MARAREAHTARELVLESKTPRTRGLKLESESLRAGAGELELEI